MRSPKSIATFTATVIFITTLFAQGIHDLHAVPVSLGFSRVSYAMLPPLMLGALVWVGTFLGAKKVAPVEGTAKLAGILATFYILAGVVINLPLKTHATAMDIPNPGALPEFSPLVPVLVSATVFLVLALFISFVMIQVIVSFFNRQKINCSP